MKHKNTQPLYIFNRENPQSSETQNGPRSGLDYIALHHTNAKLSIKKASHPKTYFSYQADFFKAMPYFEISTKYFL